MIDFRHPELLLLALALPPLGWWRLARRHGAVRHPSAGTMDASLSPRAHLAFWGVWGMRMAGLACLVLAAAGPRWPDLKTRLQADGIAILMAADVSGSMGDKSSAFLWEGEPISRLDAVKRAFRLFVAGGTAPSGEELEGRPTDLIGLVAFAALPETACPLTLSHSALLRSLEEQKPRRVPGDADTNVIDALTMGLFRLESAGPRRKVLILLTDGEHNKVDPPSGWKLAKAIRAAQAQKVPVYAIDASGGGDPKDAKKREAAVLTLQTIAESTGGEYFQADNSEGLLQVYQSIDRAERASIESNQFRRWHDATPWLALSGFGLFVAVLLLEMTWWRRIP